MLQKAYEMGISTLQPTAENMRRLGLSVTLGGGEVRLVDLASAYSAFANGGIKREPVAILKVEDNKGNVLEEHKNAPGDRVLSEEVAFIISDILADNNARLITFGERNGLIVSNYKVAVKTGTSNDKRDNWAIGWNPSVLVGTWVGNNDNSAMKKVASGISGATPIWREIISEALKTRPKKDFIVPAGVVSAEVDSVSGYRSHDGFPSRMEYFVKGTEPAGEDPIHTKLKLCSGQNKLATPALVSRGQYEQKEFFVFKEEDPISKDGKNRWQEAILSWMNSETDPRYHPPSEYCQGDMIEVAIDSPAHESSVAETFLVKLKTNSLKKITEVKVYADGELKKTFTERPYEVELTLTTGTHVIKATAKDEDGNFAEREARIGINVPWNWQPSPTPTPTSLPTITPSPFPTLIPTLSPPTGTPTLTPSPHPGD